MKKRKEERAQVFTHLLIQAEMCPRQSEYVKDLLIEPFQPDITPTARSFRREDDLLSHLDALGIKKRWCAKEREAQKFKAHLQYCTFHPFLLKFGHTIRHGSQIFQHLHATMTQSKLLSRRVQDCYAAERSYAARRGNQNTALYSVHKSVGAKAANSRTNCNLANEEVSVDWIQ